MIVSSIIGVTLQAILLTPGAAGLNVVPQLYIGIGEEPVRIERQIEVKAEHAEAANAPIEMRKTILQDKCTEHEIEDIDCWKVLEAMIQKESRGKRYAIGDQGRSYGYFQIQVVLHNVSKACAQDLECSTDWTLNNLKRHGYPNKTFYAVKRHNGGGIMAERYAYSVLGNAATMK